MHRALSVALAVSLFACKPPPELDDNDTDTDAEEVSLTEALPRLFQEFESDDDNLKVLIQAVLDGTEDLVLDGPRKDREFTIDAMAHEGLDVTAPPGTDPEEQTPVVVFGQSRHDYAVNKEVALQENQVCIESNSTVYYERTYTTDKACFEDSSCAILRSTNEVRKELGIAKGWYDLFVDLKELELDSGDKALLLRAWADQVYFGDNGTNRFAQTFAMQMWVERGDEPLFRGYALWAEIDIGLGPDAMRSLIAGSLDDNFSNGDSFGDTLTTDLEIGDYCGRDRDRPYDRPEE